MIKNKNYLNLVSKLPESRYILARMANPHVTPLMTFDSIGAKWSATMQTPDGPVTAIGESMGEAKSALDELLLITRAVEVTHRHFER